MSLQRPEARYATTYVWLYMVPVVCVCCIRTRGWHAPKFWANQEHGWRPVMCRKGWDVELVSWVAEWCMCIVYVFEMFTHILHAYLCDVYTMIMMYMWWYIFVISLFNHVRTPFSRLLCSSTFNFHKSWFSGIWDVQDNVVSCHQANWSFSTEKWAYGWKGFRPCRFWGEIRLWKFLV